MRVFSNRPRLQRQIVYLESADLRHLGMDAKRYLATARSVRATVERELGSLSMSEFVFSDLPTLQTTAENIYFDSHRCFADLDGSGRADIARHLADQLIARVRSR
jgi:hypothetical protein